MTQNEKVQKIADAIGMTMSTPEIDTFIKENVEGATAETITDDQLDNLIKFLDENKPSGVVADFIPKNALEMPSEKYMQIKKESDEALATSSAGSVIIDPVTGNSSIVAGTPDFMDSIDKDTNITDIFTGNTKEEIVSKESYSTAIKTWGLNDDESFALVEYILKIRSGEIEEGTYFDNLPENIKKVIKAAIPIESRHDKKMCELCTNEFVTSVISDSNMEEAFIDLNTSLAKEFASVNDDNLIHMHTEYIKDVYEVKILESADKLEAAGNIDGANKLRGASKAFKDAYTFEPLLTKIKNKSGIINKELSKEVRDGIFEDQILKLNAKYKHSTYMCKDARGLYPILDRHIPQDARRISADDIKKFLMLFLHICKKKDVINNPIDHAFVYHFIEFIYRLDTVDTSAEVKQYTEFNKQLIERIVKVIELIRIS